MNLCVQTATVLWVYMKRAVKPSLNHLDDQALLETPVVGNVALKVRAFEKLFSNSANQDSTAPAKVRSTFHSLCFSCVSTQFLFVLTVDLTLLHLCTSLHLFRSSKLWNRKKTQRILTSRTKVGIYIIYEEDWVLWHLFFMSLIWN